MDYSDRAATGPFATSASRASAAADGVPGSTVTRPAHVNLAQVTVFPTGQ